MKTLLTLCFLAASTLAAPYGSGLVSRNPFEDFQYAIDLDVAGKYWMFWTPDDEAQTITFEVHVEALGYVGFGLSPNGGMTASDVIIGWVLDDGSVVFHDRHALGEYEPLIDDSQDVTLLAATQNDTHTILRFSRPYVTCDEDDRDITGDTTRIIYSFTDTDPEDITGLNYHGPGNRGTKSVVLLTYNDDGQTLPEDSISMEFRVSENTVPEKRTTYWCEYLKIQPQSQKHHVVMFEPIIQPGNEGIVHHIVLYACVGEIHEQAEGFSWDCIENIMPNQYECNTAMFVWAVGGNGFYFPEHAGLPFFEEDAPVYMRIEMHYDNPSNTQGIKDSSGLRLHMTPTLRENDVGLLEFGATVHPHMMLPPHFPALTYRGYGMPRCLQASMNDTDVMNVFSVYQHSHLLGRKMRTRIFRDGAELEPLMIDENYDFNFQETRKLKEERLVYPTDQLVLDCEYGTTHMDTITTGGFATHEEMCVSFMYYYPRFNSLYALTLAPPFQTIKTVDGIEIEFTSVSPYFRIIGPPEYVNMTALEVFETLDWTDETLRNRYQELLLEQDAPMNSLCFQADGTIIEPFWEHTPVLGEEWVDPDDGQCDEVKKNKL